MADVCKLKCKKTKDGDEFVVLAMSKEAAKLANLIHEMAEEDSENDEIPLPNVDEKMLKKVIEFCEEYVKNPLPKIDKPLKSANISECVKDGWYLKFIDMEPDDACKLVVAANYMDVKPLLELACVRIACWIKDKPFDQIKKTFGVEDNEKEGKAGNTEDDQAEGCSGTVMKKTRA